MYAHDPFHDNQQFCVPSDSLLNQDLITAAFRVCADVPVQLPNSRPRTRNPHVSARIAFSSSCGLSGSASLFASIPELKVRGRTKALLLRTERPRDLSRWRSWLAKGRFGGGANRADRLQVEPPLYARADAALESDWRFPIMRGR